MSEEILQSRRDYAIKPKLARNELLWVTLSQYINPSRGCGMQESTEDAQSRAGLDIWIHADSLFLST